VQVQKIGKKRKLVLNLFTRSGEGYENEHGDAGVEHSIWGLVSYT